GGGAGRGCGARQAAGRRAGRRTEPAHLARAAARGASVIKRIASYALAAFVLAAVTGAAMVVTLLEPRSDGGAEVLFDVKRGESLRATAARLQEHGLVRDARVPTG